MRKIYAYKLKAKRTFSQIATDLKNLLNIFPNRCPEIVIPSSTGDRLIPVYVQPKLSQMQLFTPNTGTKKTSHCFSRLIVPFILAVLTFSVPVISKAQVSVSG